MRILLFCNRPDESQDASTILEHIDAFKKYSNHEIYIWSSLSGLPSADHLAQFDCLVIHYSISFLSDRYISRITLEKIRNFSGLKIVFLQDEYRRVDFMCLNLKYAKIDLIYSCAPLEVAQKMYALAGNNVDIYTTLTGYVGERWENTEVKEYSCRSIDIGYRARKCPFFLGKKGFDKYLIGEELKRFTQGRDLNLDISSRETDRLYGKKWLQFLQNCKATLGTDSGSSIIDFSGETEYKLSLFQALHPFAKFSDVPKNLLEADGKMEIQVISPRCFEAVALGTGLILFPGNYSGILRPHEHYLPLQKDFSNLDEILNMLSSENLMREMIARARKDLIESGKYSYSTFIRKFDDILNLQIRKRKIEIHTTGKPSILIEPEKLNSNFSKSHTLKSALRTFFSDIFKRLPECIRFFAMMTILRKKYFIHMYPKLWSHLKCPQN